MASCFFYMWFVPEYILCLFFLIAVDFNTAKKIKSSNTASKRKFYLIFSLVSNLDVLQALQDFQDQNRAYIAVNNEAQRDYWSLQVASGALFDAFAPPNFLPSGGDGREEGP